MNKGQEIKCSEEIYETIEKYFPKGDKRRGEALVINAVSLIEGFNQGRKQTLEDVKKMIKLLKPDSETNMIDLDNLNKLFQSNLFQSN